MQKAVLLTHKGGNQAKEDINLGQLLAVLEKQYFHQNAPKSRQPADLLQCYSKWHSTKVFPFALVIISQSIYINLNKTWLTNGNQTVSEQQKYGTMLGLSNL